MIARALRAICFVLLIAGSTARAAAQSEPSPAPSPSPLPSPVVVTPEQIIKAPMKYNGKPVIVTAFVRNLREMTSKTGKNYDVFRLCDKMCVQAFIEGRPTIANGSHVTVTGVYRTVVHSGKNIWINEISIDTIDVHKAK